MKVKKRDGSFEKFSKNKISRSILMAFNAVNPDNIPPMSKITNEIIKQLKVSETVSVDLVHQTIEEYLLESQHPKTAHAYMEYRTRRDIARQERLKPDNNALADYIHKAKYASYKDKEKRRESYIETVDRVQEMHIKKFEHLGDEFLQEIDDAFNFVRQKFVLPSMRAMQFAGKAIERDHARQYNCSFTLIDRIKVFKEIFYLLLCGCGVGYSVQFRHTEKLPRLGTISREVYHYTIPDTKEGWADAVGTLVDSYIRSSSKVYRKYVEFSYSEIRSEGSLLKTSGGKAPGHLGLKDCLENVRSRLDRAQGRQLRPIEIHDIICFIAEAVLSGGIRRSSLMCIFSADDSEMLFCKTDGVFRYAFGNDPGLEPQRAMANNAAALLRSWPIDILKPRFERIIRISQANFGEPSFFFTNSLDYGTNPCGEIGLYPIINNRTGFAFCNLCEINVAKIGNRKKFFEAAKAAAFIGTLQASYTSFPYLGTETDQIAERDALLGISITGIMDNVEISLDPEIQRQAVDRIRHENDRVAEIIDINPAARLTTVKPSGTASLELGCVGAGIHPHHARRYVRRVTANRNEPIAQEFARINPHMIENKPNGDFCICFPIEVSDAAVTVKNLPARNFLNHVFSTYENWVLPGTVRSGYPVRLTHNVSCTVTIRDDEVDEVIRMIWKNRNRVAAMSFAPLLLDKSVPYAPREEIGPEDEGRWNDLIRLYKPIDWDSFIEETDETNLQSEPACVGGACDI